MVVGTSLCVRAICQTCAAAASVHTPRMAGGGDAEPEGRLGRVHRGLRHEERRTELMSRTPRHACTTQRDTEDRTRREGHVRSKLLPRQDLSGRVQL
jgi:hypothetical protein